MPSIGWTPRIVPYGADQTLYLVVDRFGRHGSVYHETEVERTDLETIIADLMSGQFNDPVRVVAFNTLEHWSDDVSKTIALEIQTRSDIEGQDVPESIRDFVDKYTGPDRLAAGLSDAIPRRRGASRPTIPDSSNRHWRRQSIRCPLASVGSTRSSSVATDVYGGSQDCPND